MANSILDLMGYVQGQGELGRQRGTESRLARLAGQAYAAPADQRDSFVQQSIATSPQAGFALQGQLQKGQDRDFSELAKAASIFSAIPEEQKSQYYSANIAPLAHKQGFQVPTTYDARFQPALDKIASMAGMGQPGGRVQSTYIDAQGNRVAIMADGSTQVLGQNAPNNQIIDTGNGFYGVNKGNLSAAPVNVDGAPQQGPQPGLYQTPQGIARIGDDLSPEQREAAMADMAGGGMATNVQLPPRDSAPQQFGGGQQLRSAPKPPSEIDQERLRLAQNADRRAEEAAALKGQLTPVQRQKVEQTKRKETQMLSSLDAGLDQTVKLIDDVLANQGSLGGVTGMGAWGAKIPGSPWADVAAKLDTLKARSAFGSLQEMRANSPTGGALGAVSERELYLLQNAETQLQNSQSPESLVKALKEYKQTLLNSKRRMRAGVDEFYQEAEQAAGPQSPPSGDDDALIGKYLD